MAGLAWEWPSGGERWRKPAIVAVSLTLHAVVLGYMAFDVFEPSSGYNEGSLDDPMFPRPPVYVEIEPRPLLRGETARTRATPRPRDRTLSIDDAGTRLTDTAGATGSASAGTAVSPPAPRPASPGAPTPPAEVGVASWQVRPESFGDRAGRGLRSGLTGCASPGLLSPAEREFCEQRFSERAAASALIDGSGNARRDARFAAQGARALARYEARRAPLSEADNPPCDKTGPIAECEVEIRVDVFSSTRGWLPNLRGDDDQTP